MVHVHGKDARIDRGALAVKGFFASERIGQECLPGEGDGDWAALLRILARTGYGGCVDLELPAREAEGGRLERAAAQAGDPGGLPERLRASLEYLRRAALSPKPPFEPGTRLA